MKAPFKAALLKALEQIIQVADASMAAANDQVPRVGPRLRPEMQRAVLEGGLRHVRTLARAARGDERWGRRPSLEPLPPAEEGA